MAREVFVDPVESERREEIDRSREIESIPVKRDWVVPGNRTIQKATWLAERAAIGSVMAASVKTTQSHLDWLVIFSVCTALLIGAIHGKSFKAHRIWCWLSLILIIATGLGVYCNLQKIGVLKPHQPLQHTGKVSPSSSGQGLKPGVQR